PTTGCKTIGHAISLASSGDTIRVAAATYPENLTINVSLTIRGAGAATVVDGGQRGIVVKVPNARSSVTLARLTVRDASANVSGGGINNAGTLTIDDSTITGNSASTSGGGIYNASGSTLQLSNSALSGNVASLRIADGGGIENLGTLMMSGSTISGNSAT